MIEFQQVYSTPLAQRQSELEQMIKFYEVKRAESISKMLYAFSVGFTYLFIMGFAIGYNSIELGGVLGAFLFSMATLFGILGTAIIPYVETRQPNLKKKHADWIK